MPRAMCGEPRSGGGESTAANMWPIVIMLVALSACSVDGKRPGEDEEITRVATPILVTGRVVLVTPAHSGRVATFLLQSSGGPKIEIHIDGEVEYGFRPRHLRQHLMTQAPVEVFADDRYGQMTALAIADA